MISKKYGLVLKQFQDNIFFNIEMTTYIEG
jgi:hypothetical protein